MKHGMMGRNQFSGMTLSERFDSFTMPIAETGCLVWVGCCLPRGYGQFWNGHKVVKAHKWNYERCLGPVPDGLVLDHKCRITSCVNPLHLEPVTQRENVLRGDAPAARQAKQTHCIRGHLLSPDNCYKGANRARKCKQCYVSRRMERKQRAAS